MAIVRCVNEECRAEIDATYAFCPLCGTDNRSPESRVNVATCGAHSLRGGRTFCIICGEAADEPFAMSGRWRKRLATFIMLLAVVALAFAFMVLVSRRQPGSSGGELVTSSLGNDVIFWSVIGGVAAIIVGAAMFVKYKASNRGGGSLYSGYDDYDREPSGCGCLLDLLSFFWW